MRELPGGPGVRNLPANAGDTGSITVMGKVHVLQGNNPVSYNY